MKQAVIALALVGSLATLYLLSRPGVPGAREALPERAMGPRDATAPAASAVLEGGAERPATRAAAEATGPGETAAASAPAPGERRVRVLVVAPTGTPADETVEVVAVTRDVGAGRVLGVLDLGRDVESGRAMAELLRELEPEEERLDVLRAAIVRRESAVRGADGHFHAELTLAEGRDHWLHAFGDRLRTPAPTALRAATSGAAVETVRLSPELGAALDLTLVAGDGAAGGFAVADQQVALRRDDESSVASMATTESRGTRVRQTLRTDGGGRARFRALPPRTDLALLVSPDVAAPVKRRVAALAPGETRALEVALEAGATVSGTVSDPSGAAAPHARVLVLRRGQAFGMDDVVVREASADDHGRFTAAGLPTGKLIVRAEHDLWLQSQPEAIEVVGRENQGPIALRLREGKTVRGTLRYADGRPAPGVPVRARFDVAHLAGPQALGATSGARGRGESDENGAFVVPGLGAGPFVLEAEAPAPPGASPGASPSADGGAPWRARLDGVSPGASEVALTLHPPLALAGRVVDDTGAPCGDVEVVVLRTTPGALGKFDNSRSAVRTAPVDGSFRCEGLIAGQYELIVRAPTHVTLAPVEAALPADVGRSLELVAHRAGTVRGTVSAPNGAVVGGARVFVDDGKPEWSQVFEKRGAPAQAVTGADGTFVLAGVPPTEVALGARSDEWARAARVPVHLAPGEVLDGVMIVLSSGGAVTGEVYEDDGDPASGRLVQLQKMDGSGQRQVSTDAAGTFRIEHVEPGKYQVIAIDLARMGDRGQSPTEEGLDVSGLMSALEMSSVDVVEGEVVHVVLGAPPADPVRVVGRVTRAGVGMGQVIVSFLPAGPNLYERMKVASTDAEGAYSLVLDEPGDYVVALQRQIGGIGQQSTVEFRALVEDREESRHDFELPGGRISGRVVDTEGRPVGGARVSLAPSGGVRTDQLMGGNSAEISAGGDGRFTLDGLRAGTYRVSAGGAPFLGGGTGTGVRGRVTRSGLVLRTDEALDGLELVLPEPGSLAVQVRGPDGAARPRVTVFLRDAEGVPLESLSFLQTNEQGRVVVEGLAPGRYTVSARGQVEAAADGPPVTVRAGEESAATLTLEAGTVVRVRLDVRGEGEVPAASIRVLDGEGRDMAGMLGMEDLQALYLEGAYSRTEHRLGPVPPGRYTVSATGEGFSGERRLTLRGEPERIVTLTLDPD